MSVEMIGAELDIIILDWTYIPDLLMYSIALCFSRAAMDLVEVADRVKWH